MSYMSYSKKDVTEFLNKINAAISQVKYYGKAASRPNIRRIKKGTTPSEPFTFRAENWSNIGGFVVDLKNVLLATDGTIHGTESEPADVVRGRYRVTDYTWCIKVYGRHDSEDLNEDRCLRHAASVAVHCPECGSAGHYVNDQRKDLRCPDCRIDIDYPSRSEPCRCDAPYFTHALIMRDHEMADAIVRYRRRIRFIR